jgi:hypothetical protein
MAMQLLSLIPSPDLLEKIEGVEAGLRRLSRMSRTGQLILLLTVVVEAAALAKGGMPAEAHVAIAAIAIVALAMAVFFSWWIEESRNPFRYTCTVTAFTAVPTEKDGIANATQRKLAWLAPDLAWRLNERLKNRLFHLDTEAATKRPNVDLSAHIEVSGTYLVRALEPTRRAKTESGIKDAIAKGESASTAALDAELLIFPRVRIGPAGTPETMPPHVSFLFTGRHPDQAQNYTEPKKQEPHNEETNKNVAANGGQDHKTLTSALTDRDYDELVERVYYHVASEIYKQIEKDVDRKISFLPTRRMRGAAVLHEANDFARSNTLNAYATAEGLYRRAVVLLLPNDTSAQALRRHLVELIPFLRSKSQSQELLLARAETGVATMLVFRSLLSSLLGQPLVTVFEARMFAERGLDRTQRINADFEGRNEQLFDAYAALSLTIAVLGDKATANQYLAEARKLKPTRALRDPVYILAESKASALRKLRLDLLSRGAELHPQHPLLTFERALEQEFAWRAEYSRPRFGRVASMVINTYEDVLRANPGHIAALANCGYILWLCGDDVVARDYFQRAELYRKLTPGTVISELHYGQARIYAAKDAELDNAFEYLANAETADRTFQSTHYASPAAYFYELITDEVLKRFASVSRRARIRERRLRRGASERERDRTRGRVFAFVHNEYGEAALQLFYRYGDPRHLRIARTAFRSAMKEDIGNTRALMNLAGLEQDYEKRVQFLTQVIELEPTRQDAGLSRIEARATRIDAYQREAKSARESAAKAKRDRIAAEQRMAALREQRVRQKPGDRDATVEPGRRRGVAGDTDAPDSTGIQLIDLELIAKQIGEQQKREDDANKLADRAEREARELAKRVQQEARPLLPYPWMWTREGDRFDASSLTNARLRQDGKWEREFGDLQVRALLALAAGLVEPPDLTLAVLRHIETRFWPIQWDAATRLLLYTDNAEEKKRLTGCLQRLAQEAAAQDSANFAAVQAVIDTGALAPPEELKALRHTMGAGARGALVYARLLRAAIRCGHERYETSVREAEEYFDEAVAAAEKLRKLGRNDSLCREPYHEPERWPLALLRLGVCKGQKFHPRRSRELISYAVRMRGYALPGLSFTVSAGLLAPANATPASRTHARLACETHLLAIGSKPDNRHIIDACMDLLRHHSGLDTVPPDPINVPLPIRMEISFEELLPDEEDTLIHKLVPQMRTRIEEETGVRVPGIRFSLFEATSTNAYRVLINEVLAAEGVLTIAGADTGLPLGRQQLLSAAIDRLDSLLRSKLSLWIEVQEVQNLLERHCNDLYRRDIEGFESHAHIRPLVYIVQELVDQGVPIIAFSDIYTVFRRTQFTHNVDDIVDEVRELPRVRPRLPGNSESFTRHILGPCTERRLISRVRRAGDASVLVLPPEELHALSAVLRDLAGRTGNAVLVVRQRELRRHVWRVVREDRLTLPVLSERELMSALSPETTYTYEVESSDIPDVPVTERRAL